MRGSSLDLAGGLPHRDGYFAAPKPRPMRAGPELTGRRRDGSVVTSRPSSTSRGAWKAWVSSPYSEEDLLAKAREALDSRAA